MKKWEKISKEELEQFVKESTSLRQLAVKCGYSDNGGSNNSSMKEMIKLYGFDTSHFTELNGVSHNKGQFDYSRFRYGNNIKSGQALNAIINLRGHRCENCGLETWLDQPITLEVHHLDGDRLNNELSNLKLLCPNCHSLTESWRGKNISHKHENYILEEDFVEALKKSKNIRQALLSLGLTAKGGNYARAHEYIVKYNIEHLLK